MLLMLCVSCALLLTTVLYIFGFSLVACSDFKRKDVGSITKGLDLRNKRLSWKQVLHTLCIRQASSGTGNAKVLPACFHFIADDSLKAGDADFQLAFSDFQIISSISKKFLRLDLKTAGNSSIGGSDTCMHGKGIRGPFYGRQYIILCVKHYETLNGRQSVAQQVLVALAFQNPAIWS